MLTLTYDRAQLFNFIGFHGCTLLLVINLCLIVLIERHLLAKHCAFNQWDSMHLVCVMTKSFQFCCIHSSSNLPSPPVALHWKEHPQHETATFTLYSRDVVRLVVSCLFPPDCFGLQMKTFFFFFFIFHCITSVLCSRSHAGFSSSVVSQYSDMSPSKCCSVCCHSKCAISANSVVLSVDLELFFTSLTAALTAQLFSSVKELSVTWRIY